MCETDMGMMGGEMGEMSGGEIDVGSGSGSVDSCGGGSGSLFVPDPG